MCKNKVFAILLSCMLVIRLFQIVVLVENYGPGYYYVYSSDTALNLGITFNEEGIYTSGTTGK